MSNNLILQLWQEEEEEKEVVESANSTFPVADVVFNVKYEIFMQCGICQFKILTLATELL